MAFRFTLHNTAGGISTIIDEPVGMDKVSLHMKRDDNYHGFLDAVDDSLGTFQFYGDAYTLLRDAYNTDGVDADVRLTIEFQCADTAVYDTLYVGKFSFEQYKEIKGASGCYIECAIENGNDLLTFRSRMNQKLSLDSVKCFDIDTTLSNYKALGEDVKLNSKLVRFLNYATVDTSGMGSKAYFAAHRNSSSDPVQNVLGEDWYYSYPYFSFFDPFQGNITDTSNNEFLTQWGTNHCFTPYTHIRSSEFGEFPGCVGDNANNTDILGLSDANELFQYTPEIPYENNKIHIDIDITGALFISDQTHSSGTINDVKAFLLKGITWNDAQSNFSQSYARGVRGCLISEISIPLVDSSGNQSTGPVTLYSNIEAGLVGGAAPSAADMDYCLFRYVYSQDVEFYPGEKLFLVFELQKEDHIDVQVVFFSNTYTYRNTYYFTTNADGSRSRDYNSPQLLTKTVNTPTITNTGGQYLAPPPASFIRLTFDSEYKATNAPVYMVNEALSRAVELTTNDSLRVYSDYFGRAGAQHSLPYGTPVTGPAGLTALSNGLLLRGYSPLQTYYMGVGQFQSREINYSLMAISAADDYSPNMGSMIFANFTSAGIIWIPDDTLAPFPVGAQILIQQSGPGPAYIVPVPGVALSAPAGVQTRGRNTQLLLTKIGDKSWMLSDHAPMFVSFQEMMEALNCIHAVGFGLEYDTIRNDGHYLVRVEPISYFYDHALTLMQCDNVETLERDASAGDAISIFKTGYTKWEAEEANGLDEFLSKREYRTTLRTLRKTLDRQCKYVASGYAIEVTRRKYGTSTTDWRYDNDTFVLCLAENTAADADHPDEPAYMSESGGMINNPAASNIPTGILSPDTVYNYRISPARNALRWLPYIANSYQNWADGKLIFTAGDGNYIAQGQVATGAIEHTPVNESQTLTLDMLDTAGPLITAPLYRNEVVKFKYPMSYEQWRYINTGNNKYGKIRYNVNDGPYEEGYILDLKYDLFGGMAEFTLRPAI
ncbi:MAG: hypothetical protein JST76_10000 [Bacteroidetes bacterium]|nr:hypothetical protein [Bacteroidota bacterium]